MRKETAVSALPWTLAAGAIGLIVLLAGCGEPFPLAQVSGSVTVDGEPLKNGHVGFYPIAPQGEINAGRPSRAKTDEQGRFELATVDGRSGAVIGKHRVMISSRPLDSPGPNRFPARFNEETELTFDVPSGGTDEANFEISLAK